MKHNYKVRKQVLKLSHDELQIIRYISNRATLVYNEAIENIESGYKDLNTYANFFTNCMEIKNHSIAKEINNEMLQRAIHKANASYESFFELLNYQKENNLEITAKPPKALESKYYPFSFSYLGSRWEKGERYFKLPLAVPFKRLMREKGKDKDFLRSIGIYSSRIDIDDKSFLRFSIPRILRNKKIKEVSFVPLKGGRKFMIAYTYLDTEIYPKVKGNGVMSIDLGVNNLATCVTDSGESFIVDGKRLKSMNQYYNKKMSYLKAKNPYVLRYNEETKKWYKDLRSNLAYKEKYKALPTKRMVHMWFKRDNKIEDYINKTSNLIIHYALANGISTIVLGYSSGFQKKGFQKSEKYDKKSNYGKHIEKMILKKKNQHFLSIPFGKLKRRLEYLSKRHGIRFVVQEESYTSKASFFDLDDIPVYTEADTNTYTFSGKREHRGLYIRNNGFQLNADVNGALNILRKSSVCDNQVIENLRRRGVNTPMRLRVV